MGTPTLSSLEGGDLGKDIYVSWVVVVGGVENNFKQQELGTRRVR